MSTPAMPDWPPDNPAWNVSVEDDVWCFDPIGAMTPLFLGEVPDRKKLRVRGPGGTLTVTASGARYGVLDTHGISELNVSGRFATIRCHGNTVAVRCDEPPSHLILVASQGSDATYDVVSPDVPPSKISITGRASRADLRKGNPNVLDSDADELRLGAGVTTVGTITTTGLLRVAHGAVTSGAVTCGTLHLNGALHAKSVTVVGQSGPWSVQATDAELTVDGALTCARGVNVPRLTADEVTVETGHLVQGPQMTPEQADRITTRQPGADLRWNTGAQITPVKGSLSARAVHVRDGRLLAHHLRLHEGSAVTVEHDLIANIITSDGPATIRSEACWVASVDAQISIETGQLAVAGTATLDTVTAESLRVESQLTATSLTVADRLVVAGRLDARSCFTHRLDVTGGAVVEATVTASGNVSVPNDTRLAALICTPAEGEPQAVEVDGQVDALTIDATVGRTIVTGSVLHEANLTAGVQVAGTVSFFMPPEQPGGGTLNVTPVRVMKPGSKLSISSDHRVLNVQLAWADGAAPTVEFTGKKSASLLPASDGEITVLANSAGVTTVHTKPSQQLDLTLGGSLRAELVGTFAMLRLIEPYPDLSINQMTVIENCSGDLRVSNIAGAISCFEPKRVKTRTTGGGSDRNRSWRPARLLTLAGEAPCTDTARIAGLDVTRLTYQEIGLLKTAEQLEPDAASIRAFATEPDISPREVQSRAGRVLHLSRSLEDKAISGSVRSTVAWSAARLHHRSTQRGEWLARAVHRAVGYGYRVWPPAVLWLVASAVVTALSIGEELSYAPTLCTMPDPNSAGATLCMTNWVDVAREFGRVTLFPFRLFRLSPGEQVFAFLPDWAQAVAGLSVGLPFIFVLLSVKRYFTLTHDK